MRELSAEDVIYYEHDLLNIVMDFVRSVVKPSLGVIKNEIWNFYIDFTHEKFID